MKKYFAVFAAILLVAPCVFGAQTRTLRVQAAAEVQVPPNRVTITVGVSAQNANLKQGAETLQKTTAQILQFCRQWNIKEKNLQTQNVSVYPQYPAENTPKKLQTLYLLNQTLSVTLEDLTQYDKILYGLLQNGANQIESLEFYSSQAAKYRQHALRQAVQKAREKAEIMAQQAGVKLGKVLTLEEENNAFGGFANTRQNLLVADSTAQNTLAVGLISVRAQVGVVYQIN